MTDPEAALRQQIINSLPPADLKALSAALHRGDELLVRRTDDEIHVQCGPVTASVPVSEIG